MSPAREDLGEFTDRTEQQSIPGSPTVAFCTLGCKVNQAETDALAGEFRQSGFAQVPFESRADVYIVNTCSVTHVADAKSRQMLRRAKHANPDALVVATGCYASIVRDDLPIDEVLVIRNRDKDNLLSIARNHLPVSSDSPAAWDKSVVQGLDSSAPPWRTRAMVKVQDGCDGACAYCIIPRARGRSRSVAPSRVVQHVRRQVEQGHQEVVITGVDLGSYGEDGEALPDLGGLLELLLRSTDVHRLRVSSVEPGDFKREWLAHWQDTRLCRHLHVPLQAGADSVLARMRRQYDTSTFFEMIRASRAAIEGVAITTDLITGFPGETEREFEEGLEFIDQCEFDGMHVFPYSRRPGTGAAHLTGHVPDSVKKRRGEILRTRANGATRRHVQRQLGTEQEVVWESARQGVWRGTSANNTRVFADDACLEAGALDRRRLMARYANGCWGEPAKAWPSAEMPLRAV